MLTRRYCDLTNESVLQIIVVHSIIRISTKYKALSIMLLVAGIVGMATIIVQPSFAQVTAQKEKVVLTSVFVQLHTNREMAKSLLNNALAKLRIMYPNLDIQLKYLEYPTNQLRSQLLTTLNGTKASGSIDLISLEESFPRRNS